MDLQGPEYIVICSSVSFSFKRNLKMWLFAPIEIPLQSQRTCHWHSRSPPLTRQGRAPILASLTLSDVLRWLRKSLLPPLQKLVADFRAQSLMPATNGQQSSHHISSTDPRPHPSIRLYEGACRVALAATQIPVGMGPRAARIILASWGTSSVHP